MSAELMGKDLTITNGDLQFSNNQDFSITSGYENLKQAIFDRLQTIKGEYYNEFYGSELDKCYSLPINQTLKNQIIGYVVEALNQEPRIKSKEVGVEFLQEGNVNYAIINMKIVPIDTNISLNLIYPLFV
jgi:phage baseplate assembly protein W